MAENRTRLTFHAKTQRRKDAKNRAIHWWGSLRSTRPTIFVLCAFAPRAFARKITHVLFPSAACVVAVMLFVAGNSAGGGRPQGAAAAGNARRRGHSARKRETPLGPFLHRERRPRVRLGQFFDGKRPVILTMNYSNCPRLCSLQLNGLVKAMRAMPWDLGRQFQMVTVIIDPTESPERARLAKQGYLNSYGRPGSAAGWHFLTGRDEDIKRGGRRARASATDTSPGSAILPSGRLDPLHARRAGVALSGRDPVRSADVAAGAGRGLGGQGRNGLRPGPALLLSL